MDLKNVNNRIHIENYTFSEYAKYFAICNGKVLCAKFEDETIEIKIGNNQLPHLIGLQYVYDKQANERNYKGEKGFQLLLNDDINIS